MSLDQLLIEAYQSGNVYQGWITAAIGAAGSILGGLFGSKKKKEETITDQTSTSSVDYQKMVDDATAAGFNPLTAIRNGGTGGYVTTRTYGKNVTTTSGGGSIGAGIADAIGQIAPMFGSIGMKTDPIKVKSKTTGETRALVDRQLRGSTLRSGSVVVAPRQTVRTSPTTTRPPGKGVYGPPSPREWALANGGMDMEIPYYNRRTGRIEWGVNPAIADNEQLAMPAAITAANQFPMSPWVTKASDGYDAAIKAASKPLVRVKPITPAQKREVEKSWHRGWLPSISFTRK